MKKKITYHDNDVFIRVIDKDNNHVNTSNWALDFGPAVGDQLEDTHASRKFVDNDGNRVGDSEIMIRLRSGRHKTTELGIEHMNTGYDTTYPIDDKWPKDEPSKTGNHHSATISVKGDFKLPEKVNFFFPVKITTDQGFVYNIILAQTGSGKGFLHDLKDIGKIYNDISEIGEDAETEDDIGLAYHVHEFKDDLVDLFGKFNNPWILTAKGTELNPAAARPNGLDKEILSGEKENDTHVGVSIYSTHFLSDIFPYKNKKQMGYFYHDPKASESENSFSLKIYS